MKFLINFFIYGIEEGPHMWPKPLPYFLRFCLIFAINNFQSENKKNLILCQNNKMNKNYCILL